MNEKFLELPIEKQHKIINAGMKVFGQNEYKHAITDEIAFQAGISKGLLFYYFHNKKSLYLYLYQCCIDIMDQAVLNEDFEEIDDFFDLMEFGAQKKLSIVQEYPYIIDFVMRAFYSQREEVSVSISQRTQELMANSFASYFSYVDFSRFKDEIDPQYIYKMLMWMSEGYLFEQQNGGKKIDVDEIMAEFRRWKLMFKPMVYKEEFL